MPKSYQVASEYISLFLRLECKTNYHSITRFEQAKRKISTKYDEIERALIEDFVRAHRSENKPRMKEIATILSQFKGYSQCVDAFIEESQMVIAY